MMRLNRNRRRPKPESIDTQGVSSKGGIFFMLGVLQIFCTSATLRALASNNWLSDAHLSSREYLLLALAATSGITIQVSVILRVAEFWHRTSTIVNVLCGILQVLCVIATLMCFHFIGASDIGGMFASGQTWSQGLFAAWNGSVMAVIISWLSVRDRYVTKGDNSLIGKTRKRVIVSNQMAVWIFTVGALFIHFIEGVPLVDSFNYSIVTALTIGYGNIVPVTTAGRIFVFFYFPIAVSAIGYYLSSVEGYVYEKGQVSLERFRKLRLKIKRKSLILKAQQRAKELAVGGSPPPIIVDDEFGEALPAPQKVLSSEMLKEKTMMVLFPDTYTSGASIKKIALAPSLKRSGSDKTPRFPALRPQGPATDIENVPEEWDHGSDIEQQQQQQQQHARISEVTAATNESSQISLVAASTPKSIFDPHEEEIQSQIEIIKASRLIVVCFAWWFGSAGVFRVLQPGWTYMEALYFTFCTLTTIGYGDFFPTTPAAWEFWNVFIMIGVAGAAVLIGQLTELVYSRVARNTAKNKAKKKFRRSKSGRRTVEVEQKFQLMNQIMSTSGLMPPEDYEDLYTNDVSRRSTRSHKIVTIAPPTVVDEVATFHEVTSGDLDGESIE